MGLGRQQHRPVADLGFRNAASACVVARPAAAHRPSGCPPPRTLRAPSSRKRCGDLFVLRQHACRKPTSSAAARLRRAPQPAAERAEMRALTSASRTPRAARRRIRLGHRSDSTNRPGVRLPVIQEARHRAAACPAARIDGWRPSGSRWPIICGAGDGAAGHQHAWHPASSFSIRGRAARLSPTLAPCTQISRPGGPRPGRPCPAARSAGSGLPCRAPRAGAAAAAPAGDSSAVKHAPGREAQRQTCARPIRRAPARPDCGDRAWHKGRPRAISSAWLPDSTTRPRSST